jgi:hypothetical protein
MSVEIKLRYLVELGALQWWLALPDTDIEICELKYIHTVVSLCKLETIISMQTLKSAWDKGHSPISTSKQVVG